MLTRARRSPNPATWASGSSSRPATAASSPRSAAALAFPGWQFVAGRASSDAEWPSPEEDGETFEDNARIKARAARERFAFAALADDSGLEVDALDGEPGVYCSRYAGPCATDAENNARLLLALQDVPEAQRTARFRCTIVFIDEDGTETVATGACEGRIGFEPRGEQRFRLRPALPARRDARPNDGRALPRREERDQPPRRGPASAASEAGGGVARLRLPAARPLATLFLAP